MNDDEDLKEAQEYFRELITPPDKRTIPTKLIADAMKFIGVSSEVHAAFLEYIKEQEKKQHER